MTALRSLLGTWLICVSFASAMPSAHAQHAPLPTDPSAWLARVPASADVVAELADQRLTSDGCRVVAGELVCRCLRGPDSAYSSWSEHELNGATLTSRNELVTIGEAIRVDGLWHLENVVIVKDDAVLLIEQMRIGESVEAVKLSWHEATDEPTVDCPTEVTPGAQLARADGAVRVDGQWRLSGFRVGPWPVPLARSASRAAPGLLPPSVRATHAGAVEAEAAAAVLGPLFVVASGGLDVPIAAGLGVTSTRREQGLILRGVLGADDGEFGSAVVGDLSFGQSTHVRGHFEHPMMERMWAVRRSELGGFYRDWRATHVGAAATAGAHSLQLTGSVITDPVRPVDEQAVLLSYGTTFSSGRLGEWTVDLEHASDRADDTRHSTTVGLGVETPLGWPQRAWLTPRLDLLANYAAVTVSRGFDASTTLSALGSVEAGIAVEGRFHDVRHRLAPTLRVGGELTGIQQRQAREGAPPYPYDGPGGWRWATAYLEQSIRAGSLVFEVPVGVFADALGDEDLMQGAQSYTLFGRAGFVLPQARVDVVSACVDGCSRVGAYLAAFVRPRADLRLGYAVADLDASDIAVIFADQLTDRGFTAVRLLNAATTSGGFGHVASLDWRRGRASVGLEGRVAAAREERGVGARIGYFYEELGWGIGLGGSLAVPTEEWAISAGLQASR